MCERVVCTMTSVERLNSLDDWVAVKDEAFTKEPMKTRFRFIVSWNELERKVNIICHEGKSRVVKRTLDNKVGVIKSRSRKDTLENGHDGGDEPKSWCGLLSLGEIAYAYQQMCLVEQELANETLELPNEPRGIWSLIYSTEIPLNFCEKLEHYLCRATEICGKKLVTEILFNSERGIDNYLENFSELRQKAYEADVAGVKKRLDDVESDRFDVCNMMDMLKHYEKQDNILGDLAVARAELFNIQLQPFLDMRELAFNILLDLQERLMDEYLTDTKRDEFVMQYSEWQEEYVQAIEAIHEYRIQYFGQCQECTRYILAHLAEDSQRFGASTWELFGADRIRQFEQTQAQEKIQIKHAKQDKLKHQQDKIQQELAVLEEGPGLSHEIKRLQNAAHDLHLKRLDLDLSILLDEETLLKAQLKELKIEFEEAEALREDEFYDAFDSMAAIDDCDEDIPDDDGEDNSKKPQEDPKVKELRDKLSKINRKKARIRSRKQHILGKQRNKEEQKQAEKDKQIAHHRIQQKRDERAAELEERKDFLQTERKKTLERLQRYQLKYPTAKLIKPQQYKTSRSNLQPSRSSSTPSRNSTPSGAARSGCTSSGSRSVTPKKSSANNSKVAKGKSPSEKKQQKKTKPSDSDTLPVNDSAGSPPAPPPPPPPPAAAPPPPPPRPPPPPASSPPLPPPYPPPGSKNAPSSTSKVSKEKEGPGAALGGLDMNAILQAKNKLQTRPRAESKGKKSDSVAMMDTLKLIRDGVQLRKAQKTPTEECDSLPSFSSRHENWENTELYRAIEKVRQQVKNDSDDDESEDETDDSFC